MAMEPHLPIKVCVGGGYSYDIVRLHLHYSMYGVDHCMTMKLSSCEYLSFSSCVEYLDPVTKYCTKCADTCLGCNGPSNMECVGGCADGFCIVSDRCTECEEGSFN